MTIKEYRTQLDVSGYCIFRNVLPPNLLGKLQVGVDEAIDADIRNGWSTGQYSYLALNNHDSFVELLESSPLQRYVDDVLDDTCIIHSFSAGRGQLKEDNPISSAIHRDTPRFCRPYILSVQILYMIDDFTLENGATYILAGSHKTKSKPPDEKFFAKAARLIGKAGDAVIFDSLIWHAGGANISRARRRLITCVYSRSFMKQQIDLPRALKGKVLEKLGDRSRRLIGHNVIVPASMDEFVLPAEKRLYKRNQG